MRRLVGGSTVVETRAGRLGTSGKRGRCLGPVLALLLAAAGMAGPGLVRSQAGSVQEDATPGSGPAECAVPEVAAAAPAVGDATAAADATPDDAAKPPPEAIDEATALAEELRAVTRALAACLSDGQARTVASLATERYLGQLYGGGIPLPREDYLALAPDLDRIPTVIRSVRNAARDDDEATAEVVSVVGQQLLYGRWTFVRAPEDERREGRTAWRVDGERALPFDPPADAVRIEVAIEEYAFGLDEAEAGGPTVVLAGRNAGEEDHELLVLRLDDDVSAEAILREPGPGLPDGVTYVGQRTVPAGEDAELVLVDLERGDYLLVCLFPTPRGTPHLALGMEATFTIR